MIALLFHDAMAANLRQPPHLQWMWWLLGLYLALITCLVIQLIAHFQRIPEGGPPMAGR